MIFLILSLPFEKNDINRQKHLIITAMDIKKKISRLLKKEKEHRLSSVVFEFLSQEGFRPQIEDDYICFKNEGYSMYISLDERDPLYLRVVLPNFFNIDKQDINWIYILINRLNVQYKFGYLTIDSNIVSSFTDIYVNEENPGSILFRVISITKEIAHDFCEEVNKQFSLN